MATATKTAGAPVLPTSSGDSDPHQAPAADVAAASSPEFNRAGALIEEIADAVLSLRAVAVRAIDSNDPEGHGCLLVAVREGLGRVGWLADLGVAELAAGLAA